MEEVWKDIVAVYQASNLGRLKNSKTGRLLRPGKDKNGYLFIGLRVNGKTKWYKVHRLVWEAFYGPIPEGYEINHINEVKTDNRLENLSLVTHKENINWGTCRKRAGEKHRKAVIQYNLEGKKLESWESASAAADALEIDVAQISACCLGKPHYNTAGGFIWKYKEKEQA